MPQVHDREEATDQGTPSPQALAEVLSIACPICEAPVGAWCERRSGFNIRVGLHAKRADAYNALAVEKVTAGEWEYIDACDHGSHHYCYPCTSANWYEDDAATRCARCGEDLDKPSGEIPGASQSIVTNGEGDRWHTKCAPEVVLRDVTGEHFP